MGSGSNAKPELSPDEKFKNDIEKYLQFLNNFVGEWKNKTGNP
jgi:hypothetical protein